MSGHTQNNLLGCAKVLQPLFLNFLIVFISTYAYDYLRKEIQFLYYLTFSLTVVHVQTEINTRVGSVDSTVFN